MEHWFLMDHWVVLAIALIIDRLVGEPAWLWGRYPHPVVFFGKCIAACDVAFNREGAARILRKIAGTVVIILLLAFAASLGLVMEALLDGLGLAGLAAKILIMAIFLAQKSLSDHVQAVLDGLEAGLEEGRLAVSKIVGRDPASLDEAGVTRAAIESLAENFSDGVVAPVLCYAVAGLPGLLAYKMLNTADSMIGHRTSRHEDFGWATARLDDLANWPAARLSWLLLAVAAHFAHGRDVARRALQIGWRDARLHRSPNSGWPEATMAGALDLQLAGPRVYQGEMVKEPMMNAQGRAFARPADISSALNLYELSCDALLFLVVLGGVMGAVF